MKNERIYLVHMRDTAMRISSKIDGKTKAQFVNDDNLVLAVTHLLQTIGEAARLVNDPVRASFPNIPWKMITGMRHKIVHDYLTVDIDVVWVAASQDVPELIAQFNSVPEMLVIEDP